MRVQEREDKERGERGEIEERELGEGKIPVISERPPHRTMLLNNSF